MYKYLESKHITITELTIIDVSARYWTLRDIAGSLGSAVYSVYLDGMGEAMSLFVTCCFYRIGDTMSYYVFFVETGKEERIGQYIKRYLPDIHYLIPRRYITEKKAGKIHVVFKLMFPGYIFIECEENLEFSTYYTIKKIPHVFRMLSYSIATQTKVVGKLKRYNRDYYNSIITADEQLQSEFFLKVADDEMNNILELLDDDQIINQSVLTTINGEVCALSGPLVGLEHIIMKVDKRKRKAKIKLYMFGEERYMYVDTK
ncbi:antiterminator LoaP [Paenibacillus apiarius]|uniref:Antiterminator LoaP n=1 Tax=Paenibacillus apiarius TaxID=46240 RepID=A0ABT4E071_9BACL|nr:antiterminator LoaP [Paenibacillus apiarius]MCY9514968.1 antiterminator LoaP [Paenibacillus apiarius]MCY9522405.1 antiterminator LoaP [Paenibacillus apiarius]MCY9552175.1 antiterminator LoaP [Paenibacillus apiarius]MCY9561038.1 antiterminator LoaP [Paenibacillus apiarius]MCY9686321.1 antiterminator LoaP [Paenibacillus apiarius]